MHNREPGCTIQIAVLNVFSQLLPTRDDRNYSDSEFVTEVVIKCHAIKYDLIKSSTIQLFEGEYRWVVYWLLSLIAIDDQLLLHELLLEYCLATL